MSEKIEKWFDKQTALTVGQLEMAQQNAVKAQQVMVDAQRAIFTLQGRLSALQETRRELLKIEEDETARKKVTSSKSNTKKA